MISCKKQAKSFFFFLWVCYIKSMKVKNINRLFIIVSLSVILCILMGLFIKPNSVFANGGQVAITSGQSVLTQSYSINFPEDNKGSAQTITIKNYNFDLNNGTYLVQYSFLRVESKTAIFNQFPSLVEVTEENPNAKLEYNFFENHGAGTYRIKAIIYLDNKIVAMPDELKLTIKKPTSGQWSQSLRQEQIGTSKGDFAEYAFYAEVKKDNQILDLTKYEVLWYVTYNDKQTTYVGSGSSIKWSASQAGAYQMEYKIPELNLGHAENIGNMSKNYSQYAIYALIGVAVVITIITIATTISKVKKERVW